MQKIKTKTFYCLPNELDEQLANFFMRFNNKIEIINSDLTAPDKDGKVVYVIQINVASRG